MRQTLEAIYENGVFRPATQPEVDEGAHVQLTVENGREVTGGDILSLATQVYEGLAEQDIDEVERMADRRPFFSDGTSK